MPVRKIRRIFQAVLPVLFLIPAGIFSNDIPDIFESSVLRKAFSSAAQEDFKRAADLFEKYPALKNDPYARSEYAGVLFQNGQKEKAEEEAKAAFELSGRKNEALQYAEILFKNGKVKEAEDLLLAFRKKNSDDPHIDFRLASLYEKMNDSEKEELSCHHVLLRIHRAGWSAPAYRSVCLWRLVRIHIARKQYDQARPFLIQYMDENPGSPYGRFLLAYLIYFSSGDYTRAEREFQLLFQFPIPYLARNRISVAESARAFGEVLLFQRDRKCAFYFDLAASVTEKNAYYAGMMEACSGRINTAAKILLPLYKTENPPPAVVRVILDVVKNEGKRELYFHELMRQAQRFEKKGYLQQAESFAQEALNEHLNNPSEKIPSSEFYYRLASIHSSLGNNNRAVFYLRKSLENMKEQSDFKARRSLLLVRFLSHPDVGRYNEGRKMLSSIGNPDTLGDDFFYTEGLNFFRLSDYRKSISSMTKAIEKNPVPFYYFLRALSHHERDDFENTKNDLISVLNSGQEFPEAENFLGYLYAVKNIDLEKGLELVESAVKKSPLEPAYRDSLGWIYFKQRRLEEARYQMELAVLLMEDQNKKDPVVYDHMGDVWKELNFPAKALDSYRKSELVIKREFEGQESESRSVRERKKLLDDLQKKMNQLTVPTG